MTGLDFLFSNEDRVKALFDNDFSNYKICQILVYILDNFESFDILTIIVDNLFLPIGVFVYHTELMSS
jgi:hypothetical protein